MFFAFTTFTMESVVLLGVFTMLAFGIFAFPMRLNKVISGIFPTFTFQIIDRLDMGGLIGIFTKNESGVRT